MTRPSGAVFTQPDVVAAILDLSGTSRAAAAPLSESRVHVCPLVWIDRLAPNSRWAVRPMQV